MLFLGLLLAVIALLDLGIICEWLLTAKPKPRTLILCTMAFCSFAGFLWSTNQDVLVLVLTTAVLVTPGLRLACSYRNHETKPVSSSRRIFFFVMAIPSSFLILMLWLLNDLKNFGPS